MCDRFYVRHPNVMNQDFVSPMPCLCEMNSLHTSFITSAIPTLYSMLVEGQNQLPKHNPSIILGAFHLYLKISSEEMK